MSQPESIIYVVVAMVLALSVVAGAVSIWVIWRRRPSYEERFAWLQEEMGLRERELRGIQRLIAGFNFGRLARAIEPGSIRPDLLEPGTQECLHALQEFPERSAHWRLTAMNNLAFYVSLTREETKADMAVGYARKLLEQYPRDRDPDWLNTYAGVLAAFPRHFDRPRETIETTIAMLEELITSQEIPDVHKQNARRHLEELRRALQQERV